MRALLGTPRLSTTRSYPAMRLDPRIYPGGEATPGDFFCDQIVSCLVDTDANEEELDALMRHSTENGYSV